MHSIKLYDIIDEIMFSHEICDNDIESSISNLLVGDPLDSDFAHRRSQLALQRRSDTPNDVIGRGCQHALSHMKSLHRIVTKIVVKIKLLHSFGLAVGVEPR